MPRQSPDLLLQARDFFVQNVLPGRVREAERTQPAAEERSKPLFALKSLFLTIFFAAAWFAAAICGLWQWNSSRPWAQFDVYSVGLLILLGIWCLETAHFHREMFVSREVMLEASGMNFDRLMFFWIDVFAIAEVLVFFDYGQWHLVTQLRQPYLQVPGFVLCVAGTVWLIWTDTYLSRQFRGGLTDRKMMCHGPYRFVRHPRYAGLIVCSIAFALAMASAIAWALALGWIWVNVKRVKLEDEHLRGLFGGEYDRYMARTARFLPGIY